MSGKKNAKKTAEPSTPKQAEESAEAQGEHDGAEGDVRDQFREALERKRQQTKRSGESVSKDPTAANAHGTLHSQRTFRRKSG